MGKIVLSSTALMFIEIALFIVVGKMIGIFNTLTVILLTSLLGAYMAQRQGVKTLHDIRRHFQERTAPSTTLIDAFLIFVGGVILVLPGFLTDLLGIFLLLEPTRSLIKPVIYMWIRRKTKSGQIIIIHKS